jgi:hypothetical protein
MRRGGAAVAPLLLRLRKKGRLSAPPIPDPEEGVGEDFPLQSPNGWENDAQGVGKALWDRGGFRVRPQELVEVFSSHATLTIPANGISALTTERTSTSPLGLP